MQQQALMPIDKAKALINEALDRGFLPSLGNETEKAIALVQEGFDPRFHLGVYQRRLIITKEGMHWWLRRKDHLPTASPIPIGDPMLGASERGKAYGLKDDEIGVIVGIFVPGVERAITQGFGKASTRPYTYEAPPEGAAPEVRAAARRHPDRMRNPVDAEHTYVMAEKRAENQAIRKAVPMGVYVPTREEVGVSQETGPPGMVIDTEARVLPEEPANPGTDLLDQVGRYLQRIQAAARQEELQPISYDITSDGALTQEEKALLRREIGKRSQELVK